MSKIVGFIVISLCLMFGAAPAVAADKSPLRQYVESIGYKKELMRAATGYAMQHTSCPRANPQLVRLRYHVLVPPEFKTGLANPVKGSWFEETRVIVCNSTQALDVTVLARETGGMPEFSVAKSKTKKAKEPD